MIKFRIQLVCIVLLMLSGATITLSQEAECQIGFVMPTLDRAYYQNVLEAAQTAADDAGVTLCSAGANYNADEELAAVQVFIEQGVEALALFPLENADTNAAISAANEAGIPIFLVGETIVPPAEMDAMDATPEATNSAMDSSLVIEAVIGVEAARYGAVAGEQFCASAEEGEAVVVLLGVEPPADDPQYTVSDLLQRGLAAQAAGLSAYMAENCADIEVLVEPAETFLAADSIAYLQAVFAEGKTVGGVYLPSAAVAGRAIVEVPGLALGVDVIIGELSGTSLTLLEARIITGVIAIEPTSLGTAAVQTIAEFLSGEVLEGEIAPELAFVNPDAIDAYRGRDEDCSGPGC